MHANAETDSSDEVGYLDRVPRLLGMCWQQRTGVVVGMMLAAVLLAGLLIAGSAVGVPAGDRPLPDPCGMYLSHVGTDAAYRVLVTRDADGTIRTAWGTLGEFPVTHYTGTLTPEGDVWVETYDAGPTVRSSAPWRWRIVRTRPLLDMDDGTADKAWTWDLQTVRPDL